MANLSNNRWLFPENISDAQNAQKEMSEKILTQDVLESPIRYIAGVDISNTPFDPMQMIFGAAVVLSYPDLIPIETSVKADKQEFPYIPGLLGFREVPTLVDAYNKLTIKPDVMMVDGHGVSHPRGLGVASHLGILLDVPTIGVAKSILIGHLAEPLSDEVGSMVPLIWKGKELAMAVRTKKRCSPLIISAGHKISLVTAVQLVLSCTKKYRLPETTRHAHLAANVCRKDFVNKSM